MCIRDSESGIGTTYFSFVRTRELIDELWPIVRRATNVDTPVSYTHLRAHETVLDLVCRLLLEKKKRYKDKHLIHHRINTLTISK